MIAALLALTGCQEPPGADDEVVDLGTITVGASGGAAAVDGRDGPEDGGVGADTVRACAADGLLAVAWTDDRRDPGGVVDLWVAVDDGRGFQEPLRATVGGAAIAEFALGCAEDGPVVAWVEHDRTSPITRASVDRGASWVGAPVPVEELGVPTGASDLQIGVGTGELALVWSDHRNGAYDVFVTEPDEVGVSWLDPVRLDDDLAGSAHSGHPTLAIVDGIRLVAWEDTADGERDVRVARSDNGGVSYASTTRLDDGAAGGTSSAAPVLCGAGVAWTALWREGGEEIVAAHTTDGGDAWSDPFAVGGGDGAIACAADGEVVHALWEDRSGVDHATYDGRSWSEPVQEADGTHPVIAAADDALAMGWQQDQRGFVVLEDLEDLPGTVRDLTVVVRDGTPYAVWSDGGGRVWASTFASP